MAVMWRPCRHPSPRATARRRPARTYHTHQLAPSLAHPQMDERRERSEGWAGGGDRRQSPCGPPCLRQPLLKHACSRASHQHRLQLLCLSLCSCFPPLQAPTGPPACVHARGVKPGPTVPELLGHTSGADSWHARRNTLRQDGLARTSSNLSQMEALATSLRVTTGRRPRTAQTPRYGRRQWPGRSSGSLPCPGGR
jgi:hypothetical protein